MNIQESNREKTSDIMVFDVEERKKGTQIIERTETGCIGNHEGVTCTVYLKIKGKRERTVQQSQSRI